MPDIDTSDPGRPIPDRPQPEPSVAQVAEEKETKPPKSPHHFVVREPFGKFKRGDLLDDDAVIDAVHKAGQAHNLIRVQATTPAKE